MKRFQLSFAVFAAFGALANAAPEATLLQTFSPQAPRIEKVAVMPLAPAIQAAERIRRQILARRDFQHAVKKLLQRPGSPLPEVAVDNSDKAPCVAKYAETHQKWSGACVFDVSTPQRVRGSVSAVLGLNGKLSVRLVETGATVLTDPAGPELVRREIRTRKEFIVALQNAMRLEGRPLPQVDVHNLDTAPCVAKFAASQKKVVGVCVFDASTPHRVWGSFSAVLDMTGKLSVQPLFVDLD